MINERTALVMLVGKVPSSMNDPHHTKAFYKTMQSFADSSLALWEAGKLKKFERFLNVALKLFKEGNETVKNGIVNIYLFTISHALDKKLEWAAYGQRIFPKDLMAEYHQLHYASGL